MHYDRLVTAYHGTDRTTADYILAGGQFQASANEHDWLGRGIYFWEGGIDRALRWAREHGAAEPAVVGALVQLGDCYDLMDTRFTLDLADGAAAFHEQWKRSRIPLPRNRGRGGKARFLDCAVVNWWLDRLAEHGERFQSVRRGFDEGDPIFPGMAITAESHVQIAVRDPECIVGVFRPYRLERRARGAFAAGGL